MLSKFKEFFWDKWLIPPYIIMVVVLCFAIYDCSGCHDKSEIDNEKELQMQRLREHQIQEFN